MRMHFAHHPVSPPVRFEGAKIACFFDQFWSSTAPALRSLAVWIHCFFWRPPARSFWRPWVDGKKGFPNSKIDCCISGILDEVFFLYLLRSRKRPCSATDLRKRKSPLGISSSFFTRPQKPKFYLELKWSRCLAGVLAYPVRNVSSLGKSEYWLLIRFG